MASASKKVSKLDLPPSLTVRSKFNFLTSAPSEDYFFTRIEELFPPVDERYQFIKRAHDLVKKEFAKKYRDGGSPYVEHLRACALIVVVYMREQDPDVIAAALLHDIVEDIPGWTIRRLAREFNARVANFVYWVTTPHIGPRFKTKEKAEREKHNRLWRAPRESIKLTVGDRLHNLTDTWSHDKEKIRRKVVETWDFVLPHAERHQLVYHELKELLLLIERKYGF